MGAGNQCNTCRRFGPSEAQWIYVVQQGVQHDPILTALGIGRTDPLTFCSSRCEADHAYVRATAEEAATGTEKPPRSGVGWPR